MAKNLKPELDDRKELPPAGSECPLASVTAARGLNLRAGPASAFAAAAVLPKGTEVQLLKLWSSGPQGQFEVHVDGWQYVFTGGMTGWVDVRFLEPVHGTE